MDTAGLLPFRSNELAPLLQELDEWRQRLDYKGPLPRAWEGRLRRDLEAKAIAASTSMEGVTVTVEEVLRILAGDKPASVSETDAELVTGYREAMRFVLRRADDPIFNWNRELIVALHDRILAGDYGTGAGRIRVADVSLRNAVTGDRVYLPPEPGAVPGLVDSICGIVEGWSEHPACAAAWVHVAVAAIHPFKDGNGRTARVLASLAMYRGGFKRREFTSLEEWWGNHLGDYYGAFRCLGSEFDAAAEVTPFVEGHVRAQLSQVRALDLRERTERRIWTLLTNMVTEVGLPERAVNAVWDAFWGRDVTSGYYRPLADVESTTATFDLRAAVVAGLLRAEGQRRGRVYRAGPRLFENIGRVLGVDATGAEDVARLAIVGEVTDRMVKLGASE